MTPLEKQLAQARALLAEVTDAYEETEYYQRAILTKVRAFLAGQAPEPAPRLCKHGTALEDERLGCRACYREAGVAFIAPPEPPAPCEGAHCAEPRDTHDCVWVRAECPAAGRGGGGR